jgi:hypothetical protein
MTQHELNETKKALRATRKSATQSKRAALAYLKKLGIVDKDGELTKIYREDRAA